MELHRQLEQDRLVLTEQGKEIRQLLTRLRVGEAELQELQQTTREEVARERADLAQERLRIIRQREALRQEQENRRAELDRLRHPSTCRCPNPELAADPG